MNTDTSSTSSTTAVRGSSDSNTTVTGNRITNNNTNSVRAVTSQEVLGNIEVSNNTVMNNNVNSIEITFRDNSSNIVYQHNYNSESSQRLFTNTSQLSLPLEQNRLTSQSQLPTISEQSNSNNRINRPRLRQIKSFHDIKKALTSIFDFKQHKFEKIDNPINLIDFTLNKANLLKISHSDYSELHNSCDLLENHILYNLNIFKKDLNKMNEILTYLQNIKLDLETFMNIHDVLINLINNPIQNIDQINIINKNLELLNIKYQFVTDEVYNNKMNKILFNHLDLNYKDKIYKFNIYKLKEFYVINDLDYINSINKKFINIRIIKEYYLFKDFMDNFLDFINNDNKLKYKNSILQLNIFYSRCNLQFDILFSKHNPTTLESIKNKYNGKISFKEIEKLKKTRIIEYYSTLFK